MRWVIEFMIGSRSPIGVASYEAKILKSLPNNLKSRLPTVEEIEAELSAIKTPLSEKSKN